jgi:hypothetical protein
MEREKKIPTIWELRIVKEISGTLESNNVMVPRDSSSPATLPYTANRERKKRKNRISKKIVKGTVSQD